MANQQKRMLTSDKSKLKDVKISDLSVSPLTPTRKEDEKDQKEKANPKPKRGSSNHNEGHDHI